jgi:uncharacterized cupin superfamily protein
VHVQRVLEGQVVAEEDQRAAVGLEGGFQHRAGHGLAHHLALHGELAHRACLAGRRRQRPQSDRTFGKRADHRRYLTRTS